MGQVAPDCHPDLGGVGDGRRDRGAPYTRGIGRILIPGEMTMVMVKEDERINSGAVSEATTVTSITVAGSGPVQGTWNFKSAQPNMNNVLLKETTPGTVYNAPEPTTAPTQDYPLVPGQGGLGAAGANWDGLSRGHEHLRSPQANENPDHAAAVLFLPDGRVGRRLATTSGSIGPMGEPHFRHERGPLR